MRREARASALSHSIDREWHKVRFNPLRKLFAAGRTSRHSEDHTFRLVDGRVELLPVQHQEHLQCSMADAFVPVYERVIADERKSKSGGLVHERGVEFNIVETSPWLRERRLKRAEVTNGRCAATDLQHPAIQVEHFREGEESSRHALPGYASRRYSSAFFSIT
jgi:hypothetical protein